MFQQSTISRSEKYMNSKIDLDFIARYCAAQNAASGSEVDANSNVSNKNVATMAPEVHKRENIRANRLAMYNRLNEMYPDEGYGEEYLRQVETHEIYMHDESTFAYPVPYCASITLYPFLYDGLQKLGGTTVAPKNLDSFCGGFINLIFAVSAQLKGAVATPEFLTYMDYFLRKDYGDDYWKDPAKLVDFSSRNRTIDNVITDHFQQVVYSLNQPAAARGSQSVFWNIAYFDNDYFHQLFDGFVFPDGTEIQWESTSWLQKRFMKWFNEERLRHILTFPVETVSLLNDGKTFTDPDWADFVAHMYAQGHSFFTYTSDSVDSLASCCRLRNGIQDNQFSYTLGAGGVATGSKCVITINMNRLIQDALREYFCFEPDEVNGVLLHEQIAELCSDSDKFNEALYVISQEVYTQVQKVHVYLTAYNDMLLKMRDDHMLSIYDAGFVSPEKQYLTIGINGLVEGAEFMGIPIDANKEYAMYTEAILKPIFDANKAAKTDKLMFNTEMVPAENLGVKNAKWDRASGYFVPRDCYNSYFYIVEDEKTNPVDKFYLHGGDFTKFLDGGSALHCNLEEHLSEIQYQVLLRLAVTTGCNYFTFNVPNTICNECGYISKHMLDKCPKCGSDNLDYATRVIGYLTRVSKWSKERQQEHRRRYYARGLHE